MELTQLPKGKMSQQYVMTMRPVLKKRALYSDTTSNYVIPSEPKAYSTVRIRFRTAKNNVDGVNFVYGNEHCPMEKYETDEMFDYFKYDLQLDDDRVEYYFEILSGKMKCYYDLRNVSKSPSEYHKFVLVPGLRIPKWAKGAVMYQIYVDRFYNGDPTNDVLTDEYSYVGGHVKQVTHWDKYPDTDGIREFYGGDLQGVLDKMDYLQDLGVDVIYFNPLFVSPSNHKYDIQDYDYIDPHFGKIVFDEGELLPHDCHDNRVASRYINRVADKRNLEASNQMFIKVVEEAHRRGMKVILDGVFNHCGSFNKWLDREGIYEGFAGYAKGAYVTEESPYRDYFDFKDHGKWPYNHTYDGWWGYNTLPKLNYEGSRDLYNYILQIGKKWVSAPYNCDGWRLDVAADLGHSPELNHKFWKDFSDAVKEANPDAIVLAEHYGNPKDWLMNGEWDTVMNYDAFMEPLTWFLTGMQKHSDDYREDLYGNAESFWNVMRHQRAHFPYPSLQISMNELSNHDHSRFLTRTNRKVGRVNTMGSEAANQGICKAVMREAVTVQMTWPGAPTIYYGDEAGVCGFTDPDNRRTYPWGKEDQEMIDFHREMIRIHKKNKVTATGSLKSLLTDYNLLGYGRFNEEEVIVVVLNNNDQEIHRKIPVWEVGVPRESEMEQLMLTHKEGFTTEEKIHSVYNGEVELLLPGLSAIVLKYRTRKAKNFLHFV